MKLIHLSDLHFGKRVNEVSMIEDQEYILTQILRIIDEEKADAVLIAGDVYDKSMPSAEAVTLFDDFLCRLAKRKMPTLIISGNHDSPERLAFGNRLFESSGIHISPVYNGEVEPVTLSDEYGEVTFWLLPFVKPAHVKRYYLSAEEKSSRLKQEYDAKNKAFLDEQAGIIASSLTAGMPCPVCGSLEHPNLAVVSESAPTEADVKKAKTDYEVAQKKTEQASGKASTQRGVVTTAEENLRRESVALLGEVGLESVKVEAERCEATLTEEITEVKRKIAEEE